MLAIVESKAVALHPPAAAAEHRRRFEERAGDTAGRERRRRSASRVTAADYRNLRAVVHAIHSLRMGVSDVLRSSTR